MPNQILLYRSKPNRCSDQTLFSVILISAEDILLTFIRFIWLAAMPDDATEIALPGAAGFYDVYL